MEDPPKGSGDPVLTVPRQTVANLRRSMIISGVVGLVVLVLLTLAGYSIAGLLLLVGLALGALNSWLVQRSVLRQASRGETASKKPFVGNSLGRLSLITVLALSIVVGVGAQGVATLVGLAAFQVMMLAGATLPLIRELRNS